MKKTNKQKLKERISKHEDFILKSYYNKFVYKKGSDYLKFSLNHWGSANDDLTFSTMISDFIIENKSSFKFLCKQKKYNKSLFHTYSCSGYYRSSSLANQLLDHGTKNNKTFDEGIKIITRDSLLSYAFKRIATATRHNESLQRYIFKNASDYFKVYLVSSLTELELEREGKTFWYHQLKSATTDRYRKKCYKQVSKKVLFKYLEERYAASFSRSTLPSSLEWFLLGHKLVTRLELSSFQGSGKFKPKAVKEYNTEIDDLIDNWKKADCNWTGLVLIEQAVYASKKEPYYLMGLAVEIRNAISENKANKNAYYIGWRVDAIERHVKARLSFYKVKV